MLFNLTKTKVMNILLGAVVLPIAVSCGGGGSGDPAPAAGVPALSTALILTTPVEINSTNSSGVANEEYSSVAGISTFSDNTTSTSVPVIGAEISRPSQKQKLLMVSRNLLNKIKNNQVSIALGASTNCSGGGSMTIPDNMPTSGTLTGPYTFSFNNCKAGTSTFDGSMIFSGNLNLDGSTNLASSFNAAFTFNQLTFSDVGVVFYIDGGFNISLNTTASQVTTFTLDGNMIEFRDDKSAFKLEAFNFSFISDIPANTDTVSINYTESSTELGKVTVKTLAPFKADIVGTPNPYEGSIEVSGAILLNGVSPSKLKLTVDPAGTGLDADKVTIEIDPDGTGTNLVKQNPTLSELNAFTL